MRILLSVFCFLTAVGLWSDDQGLPPWKVQAGVGVWLSAEGPWVPFVEMGGFVQALDPPGPEFFDVGARTTWGPGGWSASAGVRHKVYFVPWAASSQEVSVGWATREGRGEWLLTGRFGAGLPWNGVDSSHPDQSTEWALVWAVAWDRATGRVASDWGLALGLGLGADE